MLFAIVDVTGFIKPLLLVLLKDSYDYDIDNLYLELLNLLPYCIVAFLIDGVINSALNSLSFLSIHSILKINHFFSLNILFPFIGESWFFITFLLYKF